MQNFDPQITDARETAFGTIDCLIDGARYSIPKDAENRIYRAILERQVPVAPYIPPTPPTVDELVERAAQEFLEQDLKVKALGLVVADVIERSFGVSKPVARQQVVDRFKTYYKTLLQGGGA